MKNIIFELDGWTFEENDFIHYGYRIANPDNSHVAWIHPNLPDIGSNWEYGIPDKMIMAVRVYLRMIQ